MRRLVVVALLALAGACAGTPATPESRAHGIEAQVWSPYCPGRLLIDCTTRQARELRMQIAQRVDRGQDTPEILTWIEHEFGNEALARPGSGGWDLLIWLVPLGLFAAGALVVVRTVRRGTAREPTSGRT